MATSVLGKNLQMFTINFDLAEYLTTLTITTDFAENILNSGIATKQLNILIRAQYNIFSE